MKKRGLGRDLGSLLSSVAQSQAPITEAERQHALVDLALDQLQAGRHQPRRHFGDDALQELTESIRAQGVVQPIVVRVLDASSERYEIVAGERRWRAARMAGLARIPAVVRQMDERTAMAVALVENIQRADLNALEEADALTKLIKECGLTHEQCAQAVGKSRVAVTHLLRLHDLTREVQQWLREGDISFGHAKVLLGLQGAEQIAAAREVVERQLSVRQTEALVAAWPSRHAAKAAKPAPVSGLPDTQHIAQKYGVAVKLSPGLGGKGVLKLSYGSAEQLQRVLKALS